jgi:butyryl-CoA dehydrogenase
MDLLGRKVVMHEGRAVQLLADEIQKTIAAAEGQPELVVLGHQLRIALDTLQQVTFQLIAVGSEKGPEVFLADATLYLELFGIVVVAWQWLAQILAAQQGLAGAASEGDRRFYRGKLQTGQFFYAYELPKTMGLARRLMDEDPLTVNMQPEWFND